MDLIPAESAPKMDLAHTQQYRIPRHLHLLIPFPKSF